MWKLGADCGGCCLLLFCLVVACMCVASPLLLYLLHSTYISVRTISRKGLKPAILQAQNERVPRVSPASLQRPQPPTAPNPTTTINHEVGERKQAIWFATTTKQSKASACHTGLIASIFNPSASSPENLNIAAHTQRRENEVLHSNNSNPHLLTLRYISKHQPPSTSIQRCSNQHGSIIHSLWYTCSARVD